MGTKSGSCQLNEIKVTGREVVDNSDASRQCTPVYVDSEGTHTPLDAAVTYEGTLTPLLEAIEPRFGSVVGGDSITFSGQSFSSDTSLYTIIIDGIVCEVTAASETSVTCTTDKRPGLVESSLEIFIDGVGDVATQGMVFRYVMMWSEDVTWGGEFAPMYLETVYVPAGLNLLVDVDSTPVLNAVIVEGSIIFAPDADPNHERYFDAHYIFLNGGTMEVGTEEFPYTSKVTITMHGTVYSPYLPIYGNKVLAVRFGVLDMHGIERSPTWTLLETTVMPGENQVTLAEAVDWQPGEEVAIAATGYDGREGEKRTITAVDNSDPSKPVLTFDEPLEHKHFAAIESFGGEEIDMRAEIGLLTRNVRFRGDPETSLANEYGANMFLHSNGDDSLIGRLANIEMTDVGQGFKIGRYAVHFHQIGAVHRSYVTGCATHQGFNRAFTLHGTNFLRIENNVVYEVKGHNIFIEDAVEKQNYLYHNLVMKVKRSWSGLNTDQTPAGFWITQPDNDFIENRVGGSDRYAYWYDLQVHAIGPNANTNVCPENDRVGEFRDNHAHSCGRYGLRIFHNMVPRKYPCMGVSYDPEMPDDPYHANPPIPAIFSGLTSWKNGRNGAIAERVGDVQFHGFKVSDNKLAGIEFSLTSTHGDPQINDALIVGRSSNTDEVLEASTPRGIIAPRTDGFLIKNVRFHNFDWGEAAALGSCSHCFHPASTDSGARTINMREITLDASVTRIFNYQFPHRAIFYDEDGSVTGKGAGSWATPYYPHHDVPECEHDPDYWGSVFCDNTVQVRRIAFAGAKPGGLFTGMYNYVVRYDDELFLEGGGAINRTEYLLDKENYGELEFRPKSDPANGWPTPFVTGHKYKIHWGVTGLDFEEMQLLLSERW
jgi:hypothetical protein